MNRGPNYKLFQFESSTEWFIHGLKSGFVQLMVPKRRQYIIWINDIKFLWRHMMSPGHSELTYYKV